MPNKALYNIIIQIVLPAVLQSEGMQALLQEHSQTYQVLLNPAENCDKNKLTQ